MEHDVIVRLSDDEARLVEERVASGEFATEADVLRTGLVRLEMSRREREEFVASIEAALADEDTQTTDQVMDGLRQQYEALR